MALSPGSGGGWKQCLAQHCTDCLSRQGQRRAGLVLLTGATTRHWDDSQNYADFMPFILKANPIWFWFSLWGDCLLFLERGDPYFICHTSCREALAISQCRCWLNLALSREFSLGEPRLLTETNHKVRVKYKVVSCVANDHVPCAPSLKIIDMVLCSRLCLSDMLLSLAFDSALVNQARKKHTKKKSSGQIHWDKTANVQPLTFYCKDLAGLMSRTGHWNTVQDHCSLTGPEG